MNINHENHSAVDFSDAVVIGGGLAGLTAATLLARDRCQVKLFEKSRHLGGRAQTQKRKGFDFNLGPHALYVGGHGTKILRELDIPFNGHMPDIAGKSLVVYNGEQKPFPVKPADFVTTPLLSFRDRMSLLRIIAKLNMTKPESVAHLSVSEWLDQQTHSQPLRDLLLAFGRVATYANAPDQLSATVFIQQLQLVMKGNVYYLDGGWQILVDGLREAAQTAGTEIVTGARVTEVVDGDEMATIHLADGTTIQAGAVILAVEPHAAAQLVPGHSQLHSWAEGATPIRAAILDVALERLPRPEHLFALGIDQPLYLSVHSATARLGPANGALIHVAKYLPTEPTDANADKQELSDFLDEIQPGWRDVLVEERFLPHMDVVTRMAKATEGGLIGRPTPNLPHSKRLYLAGDWIGGQGWLADTSIASAKAAAESILMQGKSLAIRSPQTPSMPIAA